MVRILFLFVKLGFMNLIIIIANKTVIILFLIENSRCFILLFSIEHWFMRHQKKRLIAFEWWWNEGKSFDSFVGAINLWCKSIEVIFFSTKKYIKYRSTVHF